MRIMNWVVRRLEKFLERTGRYYIIHSNYNGEPTPYLVRYVLFRTRWFSIYIHRFLLSDDGVPHDHPFNFITYIAECGYWEERWEKDGDKLGKPLKKIYRQPGSWAARRKSDIHRVEVTFPHQLTDKHEAPLSLCLIGPIKRNTWGFYPEGKFVPAGEFLDDAHVKINNVPEKWRD